MSLVDVKRLREIPHWVSRALRPTEKLQNVKRRQREWTLESKHG
jgi:hypothetical protein